MQQTHPLPRGGTDLMGPLVVLRDRKSTRLNSSHLVISYAVFCLKKKIDACRRGGVRACPDAEPASFRSVSVPRVPCQLDPAYVAGHIDLLLHTPAPSPVFSDLAY